MTTEKNKWTPEQMKAAHAVWPGRTDEQIVEALDKGQRLTQATDAQVKTFASLKVDLAKFPQKAYAAAKDIDRIYLAQSGPATADPQVKALVVRLKDEYGMNANQVAALVGIPPRLINGTYAAGKREAAKAAEAKATEAKALKPTG